MSLISIVHTNIVKPVETGQTADLEVVSTPSIRNRSAIVMESQHRVIKAVPNEIVLQIVEHMDTITRRCFMATNKRISALIESHERSISKIRVDRFALPPLGNILSSATDERYVLLNNTFSMVLELEIRENKINRLIQECPKVFYMTSPPWLPSLTPLQQTRLPPILTRALHQCDHIADIAANGSCPPIPSKYYHAILDGVYELPSALLSSNDELNEFNPLTNRNARSKQIEYIQSLSLEDVAGIFILVNMIGYGLMCSYPASSTSYERKTVIEECVLRHGTWFVWSRLLGGPGMRELAGFIISAGRAELRQWEAGALDGPPGLKMTLIGRLRELLSGDPEDEVADTVAKTLKRLVLGDDKERTGWDSASEDEE
ncbi:hypothetical protein E0Z10_g1111 [Xylaria hypoxylon]|uniref:F-box domain-containing protein n=1 Tax=Xylaria hypoxylon TaxID=37992 RepID=A0A4Z0Z630_9PEZI|nr:hypothetical protein E0Z10_g1111 [Xylaria hypoxylon]